MKLSKKSLLFAGALLIVAFAVSFGNNTNVYAKSIFSKQQAETIKANNAYDVLSKIDNYQAKYFEIIKRNDALLEIGESTEVKKDIKELKKIYAEVKKQITNKKYLKEYKNIEKRYAKCNAITDIGMQDFAVNNYNEVDALLNKVYKEVQTTISADDFKKLTISEAKWQKEVDDYQQVFESMGLGSIGKLVYYDYQTDMKKFRTLLLMLYL